MLNAKGVSSFNDKMDTHHEQVESCQEIQSQLKYQCNVLAVFLYKKTNHYTIACDIYYLRNLAQ